MRPSRCEPELLSQCEILRALVPNTVMPSAAARSHSTAGRVGGSGAPSYSTMAAPVASAVTSQFHIIQPQVVA